MKVALVYSFADSDWFSCTVILKNLLKSYHQLYGTENILEIDYGESRYVSQTDLETLIDQKIEKIVFLNHKPTPINFLKKLEVIEGGKLSESREYIIHVFGDFPLYLQEWRVVFEALENKKVKMK